MARSKAAPFRWGVLFSGIFVGIIIGLMMALAAAWKLGGNAVVEIFASRDKPASTQRIPDTAPTARTGTERPNFDFYRVLPEGSNTTAGSNTAAGSSAGNAAATTGNNRTAAARPAEQLAAIAPPPETSAPPATTPTPAVSPRPRDIYWLQVGSFSRQEDADNRKAELALYGWEATIQRGEAPNRGVFYRVRVGPYDNAEQTGRMKAELTQRKFDVAVVRQ